VNTPMCWRPQSSLNTTSRNCARAGVYQNTTTAPVLQPVLYRAMLFTLRSSLLCLAASAVAPAVAKAFPGPLCTLQASGGDDAPALLKALQTCLQVTVPKDTTLSIRSPVNATDLKNVRLALHGTIKYFDDVAYWVDNAFYFGKSYHLHG